MEQRTSELQLQVGECSCRSCQNACTQRPGMFRPEEIAPLAKAMKITMKELFRKHLVVDWWQGDPDVFFLSPRRIQDEGGTMSDIDPRGQCHWYVEGKCQVHMLGKPAECKALGHVGNVPVQADREAIVNAWKPKQSMVRRLYGMKLEAPECTVIDALSFMSRMYGLSDE